MSKEAIRCASPSESNTETETVSQTVRALLPFELTKSLNRVAPFMGPTLKTGCRREKEVLQRRSQPTLNASDV